MPAEVPNGFFRLHVESLPATVRPDNRRVLENKMPKMMNRNSENRGMRNVSMPTGLLPAVLCFLLCLPGSAIPQNRLEAEADSPPRSDVILTVNIPAELFMALVSYQELSEADDQGEATTRKLINVLETIVKTLKEEQRKFTALRPEIGADASLEYRLSKLDRHLNDFQNELRYRRTLLEYQQLKKKQKSFIEGN